MNYYALQESQPARYMAFPIATMGQVPAMSPTVVKWVLIPGATVGVLLLIDRFRRKRKKRKAKR